MKRLAKIFQNGRSQAVRLPLEFRLPGTEVRISRQGAGVLLEPVIVDVDDWFAQLDTFAHEPFLSEGRSQQAAPKRPAL
jgi:antitoxin VapB